MAVMNDYFKPGDRVEVIEDFSPWFQVGMTGTVISAGGDSVSIRQDLSRAFGDGRWACPIRCLRHIPAAPAVITINRADLPEVRRENSHLFAASAAAHEVCTADLCRDSARGFLAIAEYLDAQAAAKDAAEKYETAKAAAVELQMRRDELARKIAKRAGWSGWRTETYADLFEYTRHAIDMIIAEQDESKQ